VAANFSCRLARAPPSVTSVRSTETRLYTGYYPEQERRVSLGRDGVLGDEGVGFDGITRLSPLAGPCWPRSVPEGRVVHDRIDVTLLNVSGRKGWVASAFTP
jgi:hypothetical protein